MNCQKTKEENNTTRKMECIKKINTVTQKTISMLSYFRKNSVL